MVETTFLTILIKVASLYLARPALRICLPLCGSLISDIQISDIHAQYP